MTRLLALVLGLGMLQGAHAAFVSAALVDEGAQLLIQDQEGGTWLAPRRREQVNFADPKLSLERRLIGWLAESPNCCTSYPIPLELVVIDERRRVTAFAGPQAIFNWCFAQGSTAVVYKQAAVHGPSQQTFEMRRVADGKLLRRFRLPWQGTDAETKPEQLPKWARCAADGWTPN